MDRFKAVAIGTAPGGAFIFGYLAGGTMGFWHWILVLLGLSCVLWMSFTLLVIALRVWRGEERKPNPNFIGSMQHRFPKSSDRI